MLTLKQIKYRNNKTEGRLNIQNLKFEEKQVSIRGRKENTVLFRSYNVHSCFEFILKELKFLSSTYDNCFGGIF